MPFNTEACQVLQGGTKIRSKITKCVAFNSSVQCAKDPGVKIASNLKLSQNCIDATKKK